MILKTKKKEKMKRMRRMKIKKINKIDFEKIFINDLSDNIIIYFIFFIGRFKVN